MPENAQITFNSTTLPEGACYANDQLRFNAFAAALQGFLPGTYSTFVVSETTPVPEDQGKPWLKIDAFGFPVGWYLFANGSWVWPYPVPAGGDERRIWVGSENDLKTYDGGTDTAVTPTTGPFWERDTAFNARFPVGVGTFTASGTVSVKGVTTSTAISGEDKHDLSTAEIPPHLHQINVTDQALVSGSASGAGKFATGNTTSSDGNIPTFETRNTGSGLPHNNLPPFYGVYFIKRTNRAYYLA